MCLSLLSWLFGYFLFTRALKSSILSTFLQGPSLSNKLNTPTPTPRPSANEVKHDSL